MLARFRLWLHRRRYIARQRRMAMAPNHPVFYGGYHLHRILIDEDGS